MASGSEDYWMTKSRFVGTILDNIFTGLGSGSDLLDALDALDGTMDGKLTLSQLNTSSVKTNLDTSNTKLQTSIDKLILAITQLTGIHTDTTDMINFATASGGGTLVTPGGFVLVSGVNARRNSLTINNTGGNGCDYSRDGSTDDGDIGAGNDVVFYDAPGVWLKAWGAGNTTYTWNEVSAS